MSAVWPALSHPAMLHLKTLITLKFASSHRTTNLRQPVLLSITCSRERNHISTAATDSPDRGALPMPMRTILA